MAKSTTAKQTTSNKGTSNKGTSAKAAAPAAKAGRPRRFLDDQVVTYVAAENPKREGTDTHERFKLYSKGKTVSQLLGAGVRREDLIWDVKKGFVEIQ
jgi:lipoprotein-anchoring transpeptidase ErfK/SrfK